MEACLLTKAVPADKSGLLRTVLVSRPCSSLTLTTESHPDKTNTFFRMNINKI